MFGGPPGRQRRIFPSGAPAVSRSGRFPFLARPSRGGALGHEGTSPALAMSGALPVTPRVTACTASGGRPACHPSVHPYAPQRRRRNETLQAGLKSPDAALEERGQAAAEVAGLARWDFFLSRQSRLAEELFEPAEVGGGIAAELRPQHAGVSTALEAGAHLAPALAIGTGQIAGVPAAQPGGPTG